MGITALEFYSGIGGMHCALQQVAPDAVVLDAFDINHEANRCYEHNFGKAPRQVDIEHMRSDELDAYGADIWLLAPPCQPFTRQGTQLGAKDNRSRSFLNLLDQIPVMQRPPSYVLLENVVGFETSDMHKLLMECLTASSYHVAEFILTPTQYGIPYSRPRYFCLASKHELPVALPAEAQPCRCTAALLLQLQHQHADHQTLTAAAQQTLASHGTYVRSIREHLRAAQQPQQLHAKSNGRDCISKLEPTMHHGEASQSHSCGSLSCQPAVGVPLGNFAVPETVFSRHAEVIDVVSAESHSCNCFTKAYGKLARGAGSLLATVNPAAVDSRWKLVGGTGSLFYEGYPSSLQDQVSNANQGVEATTPPAATTIAGLVATAGNNQHNAEDQFSSAGIGGGGGGRGAAAAAAAATPTPTGMPLLGASLSEATKRQGLVDAWRELRLRYFTPQEIAQLHSFPDSFCFASDMTARQCYKLLGNSLSVAVVADLLRFLLQAGGSR